MKLTIIHTSGKHTGMQQAISGKRIITLGRLPQNDCIFDDLDDSLISGFHAEIRIENDRAVIEDKDSTNGTFVNNKKISTPYTLNPNDIVQLGGKAAFKVSYAAPTLRGASAYSFAKSESPKIYGQRTVGVMIKQALDAVAGNTPAKSTDYFKALVDSKLKKTKVAIAIFIIILALTGAGFGYYLYTHRAVQVYQTTQVNYTEADGSPVAAANRYNVFMLAGYPKTSATNTLQGFCTGFAVSTNVLATNAHCVETARQNFTGITAIMNGSPQHRYTVAKLIPHPSYVEGTISPDVALAVLSKHIDKTVQMASPTELARLAPGATIFLYGFPSRLNNAEAPEATFVKGDIGRVTTFDQRFGNLGDNTLLQHSAFCSAGTSGSPIFNSAGHVVGINAGGYAEDGQKLTGYNFAMRIDLINTLFSRLTNRNAQ